MGNAECVGSAGGVGGVGSAGGVGSVRGMGGKRLIIRRIKSQPAWKGRQAY